MQTKITIIKGDEIAIHVKTQSGYHIVPRSVPEELTAHVESIIAYGEGLDGTEAKKSLDEIKEKEYLIREKEKELKLKDDELKQKESQIKIKETEIKEKDDTIADNQTIIEQKTELISIAVSHIENTVTDDQALELKDVFPEWEADKEYNKGQIRRHNGNLYTSRQDHTSQEIYPPSIHTASLWLMIVPPSEEGQVLPWEDRHTMGKELYKIGDEVAHNGFHWTSKIDNNAYEPSDATWAAWTKGNAIE